MRWHSGWHPREMQRKRKSNLGGLLLHAELKKSPPVEVRRRIEAILDRVDVAEWLQPPEKKK
jgi:hypothetical protein